MAVRPMRTFLVDDSIESSKEIKRLVASGSLKRVGRPKAEITNFVPEVEVKVDLSEMTTEFSSSIKENKVVEVDKQAEKVQNRTVKKRRTRKSST